MSGRGGFVQWHLAFTIGRGNIRAALNELFDYGRPASVTLAVLAERNGRELPIAAEIVGSHWQLDANEQIKLRGPEPLRLERIQLAAD